MPKQLLSVTTPGGLSVTYDPAAKPEPSPAATPEMKRAEELGKRIEPAIKKAVEAFRAANNGQHPKSPEALIPLLRLAAGGCRSFVEAMEAHKAAGR